MVSVKIFSLFCITAVLLMSLPVAAQDDRGKTELNSPKGPVVIEYGRPQLKGRDLLTWQKDGQYWRMGSNNMTVLKTPVDLVFGSTKVPAGTHGLWLLKVSEDRYELVLNSSTEGHGMVHDKAKDVAGVALKKEAVSKPVEVLTIDLTGAPGGGVFLLTWGTHRLSAEFSFGK